MLSSIPTLEVAWGTHNQWMISVFSTCVGIALALSLFSRFFKKY